MNYKHYLFMTVSQHEGKLLLEACHENSLTYCRWKIPFICTDAAIERDDVASLLVRKYTDISRQDIWSVSTCIVECDWGDRLGNSIQCFNVQLRDSLYDRWRHSCLSFFNYKSTNFNGLDSFEGALARMIASENPLGY